MRCRRVRYKSRNSEHIIQSYGRSHWKSVTWEILREASWERGWKRPTREDFKQMTLVLEAISLKEKKKKASRDSVNPKGFILD